MSLQSFGGRFDSYDDQWMRVYNWGVDSKISLSKSLSLKAHYGIDVLSGATQVLTVDAVTSATTISEQRHEGSAVLSYQLTPSTALSGVYGVSIEPDYATHAWGAALSTEILDRMVALSVSYGFSLQALGMVGNDAFFQRNIGQRLDVGWAQALGRRTVLTLQGSGDLTLCGDIVGCQSSPYRFIGLESLDGAVLMAVRERHPRLRLRGAAAARIAHNFGGGLALHSGYRFYYDNWKVQSHTVDAMATQSLWADRLVLRAESRFTWQSSAAFYRDRYVWDVARGRVPEYRSADREVSELFTVRVGGRAEVSFSKVGPFRRLLLDARVAHMWCRYPDFSQLPRRDAWIIGGGVSAVF